MKKSVEDVIKLIALKQAVPPPPTRLEKPGAEKEAPIGAMITHCGVTYPVKYTLHPIVGAGSVMEIYQWMIPWMYCRPRPWDGECEGLYINDDGGSQFRVTTRDQPLVWQRQHPEFNPDDPSTWGSVFGPGGFVEGMIRAYHCDSDENWNYVNCPSNADINEMVDIIRRLYAAKCWFLVAQTGSCCEFSEFGTPSCTPTTSSSCLGVFTPGGDCSGPNPCGGGAPNIVQQNDQGKKQTPIMDMVLSALKGNKMSDSIENKLRNISKSVKAPPIPTLLERVNDTKDDDIGPDGAWYPCGIRLSNNTQALIYDAIIYGIYDKSPGLPVIGGNQGRGQVTTRDPVSPLWERYNPGWNSADPNTWGVVFGPRGEAERLVRSFHCYYDAANHPWSTNCPGLTDADINRMVEELKQLLIAKCGFLVQEGGSCCTFSEFGTAECNQVGSVADCKGVYRQGGDCSGENPCGGLMQNPIQKNEEVKKQKQVMDMVMSMIKVK
jgi:hypothetical protein